MELPLSWGRFVPMVRVPHLPALGPLHPHALGPQVLRDVFAVAGTGRWLAHDKDARWGGDKPEQVVEAVAGGDHVLSAIIDGASDRLCRSEDLADRAYHPAVNEERLRRSAGVCGRCHHSAYV